MTTRQNIIRNDPTIDHIPTGYDHELKSPDDFNISSCGIEDFDEGLMSLFSNEIGFQSKEINTKSGPLQLSVPFVVFATGERFANVKKLKPVRDTNNALILPAIAIRRTGIEQTDQDITGRGINQMTGNLVIKRRLDSTDRDYQALINKTLLKNRNDVLSSERDESTSVKNSVPLQQGMLLDDMESIGDNIFEIISIPSPQFVTAKYEITFWTIHEQHMNYLIETMFASFLPQRRGFKIQSSKGYWFLADVDESFSSEENFDDFTEEKRLIQYKMNISVKGFLLSLNDKPGNVNGIKRTISAPFISFDIENIPDRTNVHKSDQIDKFLLSPIIEDNVDKQEPTVMEKFVVQKNVYNAKTGKKQVKYIKLSETNNNKNSLSKKSKGETVYDVSDLETLDSFLYR